MRGLYMAGPCVASSLDLPPSVIGHHELELFVSVQDKSLDTFFMSPCGHVIRPVDFSSASTSAPSSSSRSSHADATATPGELFSFHQEARVVCSCLSSSMIWNARRRVIREETGLEASQKSFPPRMITYVRLDHNQEIQLRQYVPEKCRWSLVGRAMTLHNVHSMHSISCLGLVVVLTASGSVYHFDENRLQSWSTVYIPDAITRVSCHPSCPMFVCFPRDDLRTFYLCGLVEGPSVDDTESCVWCACAHSVHGQRAWVVAVHAAFDLCDVVFSQDMSTIHLFVDTNGEMRSHVYSLAFLSASEVQLTPLDPSFPELHYQLVCKGVSSPTASPSSPASSTSFSRRPSFSHALPRYYSAVDYGKSVVHLFSRSSPSRWLIYSLETSSFVIRHKIACCPRTVQFIAHGKFLVISDLEGRCHVMSFPDHISHENHWMAVESETSIVCRRILDRVSVRLPRPASLPLSRESLSLSRDGRYVVHCSVDPFTHATSQLLTAKVDDLLWGRLDFHGLCYGIGVRNDSEFEIYSSLNDAIRDGHKDVHVQLSVKCAHPARYLRWFDDPSLGVRVSFSFGRIFIQDMQSHTILSVRHETDGKYFLKANAEYALEATFTFEPPYSLYSWSVTRDVLYPVLQYILLLRYACVQNQSADAISAVENVLLGQKSDETVAFAVECLLYITFTGVFEPKSRAMYLLTSNGESPVPEAVLELMCRFFLNNFNAMVLCRVLRKVDAQLWPHISACLRIGSIVDLWPFLTESAAGLSSTDCLDIFMLFFPLLLKFGSWSEVQNSDIPRFVSVIQDGVLFLTEMCTRPDMNYEKLSEIVVWLHNHLAPLDQAVVQSLNQFSHFLRDRAQKMLCSDADWYLFVELVNNGLISRRDAHEVFLASVTACAGELRSRLQFVRSASHVHFDRNVMRWDQLSIEEGRPEFCSTHFRKF